MNISRLEWHLHNWAEYMRHPSHKLGYPSRSLCIANGGGISDDAFDVMCEDMDMAHAITLDAMIDSLPANQSCAIHHKWLSAVYKLRDFDTAYFTALGNLMAMADRRGLV